MKTEQEVIDATVAGVVKALKEWFAQEDRKCADCGNNYPVEPTGFQQDFITDQWRVNGTLTRAEGNDWIHVSGRRRRLFCPSCAKKRNLWG